MTPKLIDCDSSHTIGSLRKPCLNDEGMAEHSNAVGEPTAIKDYLEARDAMGACVLCVAVNKSGKNRGKQCSNPAKPGQRFCGVHLKRGLAEGAQATGVVGALPTAAAVTVEVAIAREIAALNADEE